jgi:hypothetical protein
VSLDADEARSAIAAGAVAGARDVIEGACPAANGLPDLALGDATTDADDHERGAYRF